MTDPIAPAPSPEIDLGQTAGFWRIAQGAVDIFFQPQPGRRRMFLFRMPEGGVVLGGASGPDQARLIAVPRKGARLTETPPSAQALTEWLGQFVPPLLPAASGWPQALSDQETAVAMGQTARVPAGQTGGLVVHQGQALLWGLYPVGPGVYPAGSGVWITSDAPDTQVSLSPALPLDPQGLTLFHAAVFQVLAAMAEKAGQDSRAALSRIEQENHAHLARAVAELRDLGDAPPPPPPLPPDDRDRPVIAALALIHDLEFAPWSRAQAERVQKVPVERNYPHAPERLHRILKSLGIGGRTVRIDPAFWRSEGPPLIAWRGEDPEIGVLHWHNGAWAFHVNGTSRRVSARHRDQFQHSAVQIYPWPKDQTTRLWEVLTHAIRGGGPDRNRIALAVGVTSVAAMVLPFLLHALMDRVIPQGNRSLLALILGGLILLALTQAVFDLVLKLTSARIAARLEARTQPFAVQRLLRLPLSFFRTTPSGEVLDRALSLNGARLLLGASVAMFVISTPLAVFGTAPLAFYDPVLAVVGVTLALLGSALQFAFALPIQSLNRRGFQLQGQVEALALQLFRGIAKLRVTAAEPRAMGLWAKAYAKMRKTEVETQRWTTLQTAVSEIFTQGAFAVLLAVAAWRNGLILAPEPILPPRITAADFVAFAAAFGIVTTAARNAAQSLVNILEGIALAKRAAPIFSEPIEPQADRIVPNRLSGAIDLRGISFRPFADGPLILDNVTLTLQPGTKVALVGPSGSGKSTLLRIVLGLERPETGDVLFDGIPIERLDPATLRDQIGAVLQEGKISAGSILDNISGDRVLGIHDAWEAARRVGLDRDIQAMPMGMHTQLLDGSTAISGGQKQRILIARAVAGSPAIMVMDEATSALDNRLQAQVMDTLQNMSVTRLVVAHRLSTIRDADVIHVLVKGRIVQSGSFAQLSTAEGPFRQMINRQSL